MLGRSPTSNLRARGVRRPAAADLVSGTEPCLVAIMVIGLGGPS
jgi:hypothetical protein